MSGHGSTGGLLTVVMVFVKERGVSFQPNKSLPEDCTHDCERGKRLRGLRRVHQRVQYCIVQLSSSQTVWIEKEEP